jgi:hypothetical protein
MIRVSNPHSSSYLRIVFIVAVTKHVLMLSHREDKLFIRFGIATSFGRHYNAQFRLGTLGPRDVHTTSGAIWGAICA